LVVAQHLGTGVTVEVVATRVPNGAGIPITAGVAYRNRNQRALERDAVAYLLVEARVDVGLTDMAGHRRATYPVNSSSGCNATSLAIERIALTTRRVTANTVRGERTPSVCDAIQVIGAYVGGRRVRRGRNGGK
jgi:hypothetical protein